MQERVFPTAVDGWIVAVLVLATVVVIGGIVPIIGLLPPLARIGLLAFAAAPIVFPFWLMRTTRYIVTREALLVRSGPFFWRIPSEEIVDVRPSRSLLSAPAFSRKRLAIHRRRGGPILVSPKDRSGFLVALGFPNAESGED